MGSTNMLRKCASIVVALLIATAAAAATTTDPIVLLAPGHYDHTHLWPEAAYVGWLANQTLAGVYAAAEAQNKKGGIRGRPIEIRPIEDEGSPLRVMTLIAPHMAKPEVLGMVVPFTLPMLALTQVVKAMRVPNIGPRSILSSDFTKHANSEYNMFLRQNPSTEVTAMINFALNSHLRCKRFFIPYAGAYSLDKFAFEARDTLRKIGFPEPMMMHLYSSDDARLPDAIKSAAINFTLATTKPTCGLMVLPLEIVSPLMATLASTPGYDAEKTQYICHSFNELPRYVYNGSTALYRNFYMLRQFPLPTDETFDISKNLKRDFTALIAGGYNRSFSPILDPMHMEGYLAARFAFDIIKRVDPDQNITRETIRDALYSTRLFAIDDLVFGPYGNGCSGGQTSATGPCDCNSGVREYLTSRVNLSTGFMYPVRDDPDYPGAARMPIPLTQCALSQSFLKTPKIVVPLRDSAITSTGPVGGASWQQTVNLAMRAAVVKAREDSRLDQGPVYSDPETSANVNAATVTALETNKQVVFLAGSEINTAAVHGPAPLPIIDLAPLSAAFPDRDADWTPADRQLRVPFYPTLVDFAMAAAAYAVSRSATSNAGLFVVADTSALVALARSCVETKARVGPAGTAVPSDLTTSAAATAAFASLSPVAMATSSVILVVTRSATVLRAAQAFAAAAGTTSTVVLAADEFVLEGAWDTATAASAAGRIAFLSGLPTYDTGAGSAEKSYAAAIAETVLAFYEQRTNGTAAAMMEAAYRSSGLAVNTFSITPLYSAKCPSITAPTWPHPGGACQCAKGLGTYFVFDGARRAANTSGESAMFSYRHTGCGVAFEALPPVPSSGLTSTEKQMIGIGAAVGGILIVSVVSFLVFTRCTRVDTRNNDNAPKDATKPFAMVFTDIQSSTNLWSALPDVMGEALDAHHRLLREAVQKHKGYEVKTIGDSFMVAFEKAGNALDFALAVQTSLYNYDFQTERFDELYHTKVRETLLEVGTDDAKAAAEITQEDYTALWNGIRVRVGVHYGMGDIKFDETSKGYDYYGTVVNTAARVEGVGHGGQVVVTDCAMNAVREEEGITTTQPLLPADRGTVVSFGPMPLRGLPDPVDLHQVLPVAFEGRFFPPLRLDVEVEVEVEDDTDFARVPGGRDNDGATTNDDTASATTMNVESVDAMATEVVRRLRLKSFTATADLLAMHRFAKALFSTAKPKARQELIAGLGDNWRVKQVTRQRGMASFFRYHKDDCLLMLAVAKAMNAVGPGDGTAHTKLAPPTLCVDQVRAMSRRTSEVGPTPNRTPRLMSYQMSSDLAVGETLDTPVFMDAAMRSSETVATTPTAP